jgi:integrase
MCQRIMMYNIEEKDPMDLFRYGLRAPDTRRQYPRRFQYFLDYLKMPGILEDQAKQFISNARADPQWAQQSLMSFIEFQKERVSRGEIAESTITNYYKATKLFCVMNDLLLNWKKISRGLPVGRRAANDRAPSIEEIRKLIEYPDRRIRAIVFTMISSGIRIGAWDYLRWKDIIPVSNANGEIIAAKVRVYADDSEQYYTFITPEAYAYLKDWIDFRISYGEKIDADSWVMRDIWQTTNMKYGARLGLATFPKKLKSSGVKRLLERALWEQGLRHTLKEKERRHEWKAAHGFRKYYKTHAEQVMKPINVEITMGHDIGVSSSYYKPTEGEVLEDYLKAVALLTISNDAFISKKQILEMKEEARENEYTIMTKLKEKDVEIKTIRDKFSQMQSQMQSLLSSLSLMNETEKSTFAKQLFRGGIYKQD